MSAIRKNSGMTLLELLTTMSIIAIAAAIGFPSYRYITVSNYLSKTASDLQGSIELARSHALKTGLPTIVCPANAAGTACSNTDDWSQGWLVAVADTSCADSAIAGTPVQRLGAISDQYQAAYAPLDGTSQWLCFNRMGVSPTGYRGKFVLSLAEEPDRYKRCVVQSSAGAALTIQAGQTDNVSGESC